jgi:uncharacterized membrane protein YdjX (TVP38/TMEM64 family)
MSSASGATNRAKRAESPKPVEKKDGAANGTSTASSSADGAKKASGGLLTPKNIGILAVIVVILFGAYKFIGDKVDVKSLLEKSVAWVESQGPTAVYWYCAFTLIGVVCLIPTTPMEIAGGFLFSPIYGMWTVLAFTGTAKIIANCISVLIARHVVKDWVNKNVVAKSELLTMVSSAVRDEPWKMVFLVRGSMVPLFVKNYGLGVMDVGFLPIMACSMIFTNFYAFQNIYMGSACQDLKEVFSPKKASAGPQDWTDIAKKVLPVAFNVLLICFLVKAVKAQLKKQKAAIEEGLKKKSEKKE